MKVVLSIAGSDSGGGAGIQADLKTFEAFNVFGCSAITALTAQNTTGVTSISTIDANFVKEQLETVFKDLNVVAVKIGMLFSNEIINVVREFIKNLDIPIVLDPVFISKAGSSLLSADAVNNIKTLFPYSTIITPNLYEAKELFAYKENNEESEENLLNQNYNVIVKNLKIKKDDEVKSIDILYSNKTIKKFEKDFIETNNTHGTGCSFSSAIASSLALEKSLEDSICIANKFIYYAIKNAPNIGNGKGPIGHKLASNFIEGI